jgi:hypothetical protein
LGSYLLNSFSPTAEALGSSAIVKVSEQTGAAPKPLAMEKGKRIAE